MRPLLPIMLCTTLAITGCSRITESRLNPFNWFGASEATAPVDENGQLRPLIPENATATTIDTRGLIGNISSMRVDRTPDGAIVRATGIATTQGQFNAQLVPVGIDGGVLTLVFRVAQPAGAQTGGTTASRQISAAYVVDQATLASIRSVRVQAQENSLISRR